MPELPDDIYASVVQFSEAGDRLAGQRLFAEARDKYQKAWSLLPNPPYDWDAGFWLLTAIGDTYFLAGDYANGRRFFMDAVKWYDHARGNPFIRMRLGECMYELGELEEARNWLAGAYLLEGEVLFEHDHPKYLEFARRDLNPRSEQ
jgi:TolA-binding protein